MKKRTIPLLFLIPFLVGCGPSDDSVESIIPEDYAPTLPTYKNKSDGDVKEDDTYAYFDFYEISDFHGAVVYNKDENMLGLERLSSYYDAKRTDNVGGTIVLSGGDMWQGSADSNIARGTLVTYAMNVMNFSSMTLGNHEFDWGVDWINNNKERATFPFLAANLIDKTTNALADFVNASTIVERGKYKIGIVGTIGENIKDSIIASAVTNYDFAKEVDVVKSETAKLREQGCDIVVWSSHNDVNYLKNIIGSTNIGVDAIFGGHSHNTYSTEISFGDKVVPILESKDKGRSLPHVQLKLNKSTKVVSPVEGYACDEEPTKVDYSPDSDISGIYDQYKQSFINPSKNRYLGKAEGEFDRDEYLANLAVETMFKVVKENYPNYDCRASFTNISGGIRAKIKAGSITYGDVYEVFPFDNEIVIMETTGKKLESYVAGYGATNTARYQNVYEYGVLDAKTKYLFITTDYLGLNNSFFGKDEILVYTKINVRDEVAKAIKNYGTIKVNDYKTSAKKEFQKID